MLSVSRQQGPRGASELSNILFVLGNKDELAKALKQLEEETAKANEIIEKALADQHEVEVARDKVATSYNEVMDARERLAEATAISAQKEKDAVALLQEVEQQELACETRARELAEAEKNVAARELVCDSRESKVKARETDVAYREQEVQKREDKLAALQKV